MGKPGGKLLLEVATLGDQDKFIPYYATINKNKF
jgi:hypothetical protein